MKVRDEAIFVHFRQDEKAFVERSLDWIEWAADQYQLVTTPFLDPREQYILETLVKRNADLLYHADGGFPSAERCRAVVGPFYLTPDPELFRLAFLRIESVGKKRLEHPDVLGSLLGLGIKREKVGDIHPHHLGCDVIVAEEMCEYIRGQLGQIGKVHVSINKIAQSDLMLPEQNLSIRTVTVASLRVDAVISEAYRISRSKASQFIKSGKCKVNWKLVDHPDYSVEAGDMISLRGFGRIRVQSIDGFTKKGRIRIQIASIS